MLSSKIFLNKMNVQYNNVTDYECQMICLYFNEVKNLFLYKFGNKFDADPSKYKIIIDSSLSSSAVGQGDSGYTLIFGNDVLQILREINDTRIIHEDIIKKIEEALKFAIAHELAHVYQYKHRSFIRALPNNKRINLFGYTTRLIPNMHNTFCFSLAFNTFYLLSRINSLPFFCSRSFKTLTLGINSLNLFYGWISRSEEMDADRIAIEVLETNAGLNSYFDRYTNFRDNIINFLIWPFLSHPPEWYRKN